MRSPKRRRRSPISPKSRSANRNPSPQRRSISPYNSKSPDHSRRSLSSDIEKETNGAPSNKDRVVLERNRDRSDDDDNESEQHRLSKSSRPSNNAERNSTRDSSFKSPGKHISKDSTDTSADEEEGSRARENSRKANSARRKTKDFSTDLHSKKVDDDSSPGEKSPFMSRDSSKSFQKKHLDQISESSEDELAGRKMNRQIDSPADSRGKEREDSQSEDGSPVKKTKKRTDGNSLIDSGSSGSEEPERHKSHTEKRKHKKSHKHNKHNDDSSESDSELDDKEAKRRRKEEKKLRKEERRRRREERHRRRAERHASKQKRKHLDTDTPPSDPEKEQSSDSDAVVRKRDAHTSREESDPKKLEIELREKALESLRAKKAINH
ncbi:hypothetical protein EJB05_07199 [Eragrostis curvula]|uniref:PWI domain-containing protein n=1 Tax=Eragrostis curvula TaxID=38414 RepID=A0A5J9WHQ0_9POAL|nr:hypothetical protein EJB05_07199 [Eragrostis curvula]